MTATLAVRPFTESDRVALVALWREVFPDDAARNAPEAMIDNKLAEQPELLLVARAGAELVGAVIAGYDGTRGWLYHLAVTPTRRRQGIATQLVHAAETALRGRGCPKLNLQVRTTNRTVTAFYQSLGYEIEDRISLGRALDRDRTP